MDWKQLINEASLALALIAVVVGAVVVVVVEGTANIATTSLPAAVLVLAGALAGTKIPRP
jgi:hypothetical protein